jgi:uncharacterized membrane protein YkvA (DUF1232 family)
MSDWQPLLIALAVFGGIALAIWLALLGFLWRTRPAKEALRESLRLLPDVLRLVKRLAQDRDLPSGVRMRLGLLVFYLAMPIDLVPDFIPVLGQADDVIIALLVLRSVVRRAGPDAIRKHWPGSKTGLEVLWRAASLPGEPA